MESQTLFTIENLYVSYQNASFCSPSHALPHPLSSLLLIAVPDPGCSLVGQVLAATRATTARLAFDTSRETRWSRPDWQCMIVSVWPQDKVRLWFSRKHPEVKLHRLILGNIGDFGSVVLLRSHSAVTLQCPTLISHRIDHAFTVGSPPPPAMLRWSLDVGSFPSSVLIGSVRCSSSNCCMITTGRPCARLLS